MRRGWFVIPGVQHGDVTLEDQIIALKPAFAEAPGKTVLDIGCAEGLISREFAKAGAREITALDSIEEHLQVAREQCRGYPITFVLANINEPQPAYSADIVLALGVVHKLRYPEIGVRFAAVCCRDLLLIRSGRGATKGIIRSKHHGNICDSHATLKGEGFVLERTVRGPEDRAEDVEYWRRA